MAGLHGVSRTVDAEDVPPIVDLYQFRETVPGSGELARLERELKRIDSSAQVILDEAGGRAALDAEGWGPSSSRSVSLPSIFAAAGFRLEPESELEINYGGGPTSLLITCLGSGPSHELAAYLGILVIAVYLRRRDRLIGESRRGASRASVLTRALALGLLAGATVLGVHQIACFVQAQLGILDSAAGEGRPNLARAGWTGFLIFTFMKSIPGALAVELYFRGWALPYLHRRSGLGTAYVGSALVPAILLAGDVAAMPALFVSGLVLAWVYRYSGSLVATVLASLLYSQIWFLQLAAKTPPF